MKKDIPVRALTRLSGMLACMMSGIVFLILLHEKRGEETVFFTVMTALTIALIGFFNIYILVKLVNRFGPNSRKLTVYRYVYSYAVSAIAYLVVWPLCISFFLKQPWFYTDLIVFITFFLASALVNSMILVLHNSILLQSQKIRADLEFSNLKIAHAEAVNLLLKQQIHPHFLFNALNTLKALYKKDSQAGETYVVHLANFLRASVFSHAAKVATLEQELTLLNDYLEMQKMRFGEALLFTLAVPVQSRHQLYLPSFSLQPLLENAIKHNELTEADPLRVSLCQQGDRIIMANNLKRKSIKLDSTQHGLANLADRYRLLSGDEVLIAEDETLFSVSIKLLTDEYSHH